MSSSWSRKDSAAMLEFNKQVNASIIDPAFIVSVRKKLSDQDGLRGGTIKLDYFFELTG